MSTSPSATVPGGDKGCRSGPIAEVVRREVERQKNLLSLREELRERKGAVKSEPADVTRVFSKTGSSILKKAPCVLAVVLEGFGGLVGREIQPGRDWKRVLDYAKKCGVGGIFHTIDPCLWYHRRRGAKAQVSLSARALTVLCWWRGLGEKLVLPARSSPAEKALRVFPEETRRMLEDGARPT
jgi:glutamyl-tRNA(Gln) amidotransferase subunit E